MVKISNWSCGWCRVLKDAMTIMSRERERKREGGRKEKNRPTRRSCWVFPERRFPLRFNRLKIILKKQFPKVNTEHISLWRSPGVQPLARCGMVWSVWWRQLPPRPCHSAHGEEGSPGGSCGESPARSSVMRSFWMNEARLSQEGNARSFFSKIICERLV